jgi:hypothetical protein
MQRRQALYKLQPDRNVGNNFGTKPEDYQLGFEPTAIQSYWCIECDCDKVRE